MRLVFSYSAPMTDAAPALTFEAARARVDAYISQFKEGYFPPLLMLARLTEETGEIARVIAHQNGKTPKPGEDVGDLELELADLLFVMICMANERGLSLERGFERMMTKVETRDAERWTRKVETAESNSAT
ncbi:transcriptional regulator [Deinococcus sp. Arct2-2]|nr:transcriptional regulator [Deinococcus sp. Arct2-2]